MSKRIYSQDEVARVIRRAVELEADRSVSGKDGTHTGLDINELEHIAAESGIDPQLIRQAAKELETDAGSHKTSEELADTKINRTEIFCERWLDIEPDNRMLDDLITELNQKFGTSEDDVSWWDELWGNYSGKAKINKTPYSREWEYTDDLEAHTTRVLLQKRGGRLRLRVSKRQTYGFEWNVEGKNHWIYIPLAAVLAVIGGAIGNYSFDSFWIGAAGGVVLSAILFPFAKKYSVHSINKHRRLVTDLTDELADFAHLIMRETGKKKHKKAQGNPEEIEVKDSEDENRDQSGSERIRNQLR